MASPEEVYRDAVAEEARRSFYDFVRLIRPEFDVQWFHDYMIAELQLAGTANHDTRLGLALPPGHAKSEYALLYCAWMVARDPDITIKYVTYKQEFAEEQFERLKEILELDAYIEYFGRRINSRRVVTDTTKGGKNSAQRFDIIGGKGWVQACGFGGGITGGRCDIIVIDDPFKNHEEANSPTVRDKRWAEYGASIKTRRRPGRPLRILMLFTRWHLDDLTGRCKKVEGDEWRWIELEALKTEAANDDVEDPRQPGEALWPAVADAKFLKKERTQRPGIFSALWQQKPVPDEGAVFLVDWFKKTWSVLPTGGVWIQSWDPRHGGKGKKSSFAVAMLWYFTTTAAYIVDLRRGRWSPSGTLEVFDALQSDPLWGQATIRLIEEKGDGVMLMDLRGTKHVGMIGIKPSGDKVTRARNVTPFFKAGNVYRPEQTPPWWAEYLLEMTTFPSAANDDQVDATSQVLDFRFLSGQINPNADKGGVVKTKHTSRASRLKKFA